MKITHYTESRWNKIYLKQVSPDKKDLYNFAILPQIVNILENTTFNVKYITMADDLFYVLKTINLEETPAIESLKENGEEQKVHTYKKLILKNLKAYLSYEAKNKNDIGKIFLTAYKEMLSTVISNNQTECKLRIPFDVVTKLSGEFEVKGKFENEILMKKPRTKQ